MAQKIVTDGDADRIFDRMQFENDRAEREQRETVRLAEIEYLDGTQTHADFSRAMEEKNELLAEEDLPLDECSYRDYRIRRAAGEGK